MSSTPSLKQQAPPVTNIKMTTPKYLACKNLLIPSCFSLVIILYLFTFCDLKIVGSLGQPGYPETAEKQKSVTGFNFITGTSLPITGVNNEFISGVVGIENEHTQIPDKITFNIWALLALAAAIGGIVVHLPRKKENHQYFYSLLVGATGVVVLLLLMSSVVKYEGKIVLAYASRQTEMVFQLPYWLALLSFTTAGLVSLFRLTYKSNANTRIVSHTPTPIYVSIIMQDAGSPNDQ